MEGIYNVLNRIEEIKNKMHTRQFEPINKLYAKQRDFYSLFRSNLAETNNAIKKNKTIENRSNNTKKIEKGNLENTPGMAKILDLLKTKAFKTNSLDSRAAYDKFKGDYTNPK